MVPLPRELILVLTQVLETLLPVVSWLDGSSASPVFLETLLLQSFSEWDIIISTTISPIVLLVKNLQIVVVLFSQAETAMNSAMLFKVFVIEIGMVLSSIKCTGGSVNNVINCLVTRNRAIRINILIRSDPPRPAQDNPIISLFTTAVSSAGSYFTLDGAILRWGYRCWEEIVERRKKPLPLLKEAKQNND